MIDNKVFRDISYGLYIVSTKYNEKNVGCVINTLSSNQICGKLFKNT